MRQWTFARRFGCGVAVMENGEHWFRTPERLSVLEQWTTQRICNRTRRYGYGKGTVIDAFYSGFSHSFQIFKGDQPGLHSEMLDLWARRKGLTHQSVQAFYASTGGTEESTWQVRSSVFVLKDAYRADASALPGSASGASQRFAAAFDSSACPSRVFLWARRSAPSTKGRENEKVHNVIRVAGF